MSTITKLNQFILFFFILLVCSSCNKTDIQIQEEETLGFELMNKVKGLWLGTNQSAQQDYDYYLLDFRPVSPSHVFANFQDSADFNLNHSIFVAESENQKYVMGRIGGWMGQMYMTNYYTLDYEKIDADSSIFRLVDAVGGAEVNYLEFLFIQDSMYFQSVRFDVGHPDSGIYELSFSGQLLRNDLADRAGEQFLFPKEIPMLNADNDFNMLEYPETAMFFDEQKDPMPSSSIENQGHLKLKIVRNLFTEEKELLLYVTTDTLITPQGLVNLDHLEKNLIRYVKLVKTTRK
jgi:hypothetical protein